MCLFPASTLLDVTGAHPDMQKHWLELKMVKVVWFKCQYGFVAALLD
jgi:hypothetical protein